MLHFRTSYMNENKKRKQTLESDQYWTGGSKNRATGENILSLMEEFC